MNDHKYLQYLREFNENSKLLTYLKKEFLNSPLFKFDSDKNIYKFTEIISAVEWCIIKYKLFDYDNIYIIVCDKFFKEVFDIDTIFVYELIHKISEHLKPYSYEDGNIMNITIENFSEIIYLDKNLCETLNFDFQPNNQSCCYKITRIVNLPTIHLTEKIPSWGDFYCINKTIPYFFYVDRFINYVIFEIKFSNFLNSIFNTNQYTFKFSNIHTKLLKLLFPNYVKEKRNKLICCIEKTQLHEIFKVKYIHKNQLLYLINQQIKLKIFADLNFN